MTTVLKVFRDIYSKFITVCKNFDTLDRIIPKFAQFFQNDPTTALNKTFMESDGIGQLSRFLCIINYGTQIVSLKNSQSATNIWNFP